MSRVEGSRPFHLEQIDLATPQLCGFGSVKLAASTPRVYKPYQEHKYRAAFETSPTKSKMLAFDICR